MLPVPALKPNEEPFNPATVYETHPQLKTGLRAPALPSSRTGAEEDIPLRALDHALVKEAITSLHQEDDAETEKLRAYAGTRICDIVPEYARFVAAQKEKYANLLKTNAQRHYFRQSAAAYFEQAPMRGRALRNAAIRQCQRDAIDRQNGEFLARALRPENILNDQLQTRYRDMILHNAELLLDDQDGIPPEERQSVLDRTARDLYVKIMDKRLAIAPESLVPLLSSEAVKRVLAREERRTYRETVRKAIAARAMSQKALKWVRTGAAPEEAAEKELLDEYRRHKYNADRKRCLQTILDLDNAWRTLKQAGYNPTSIPDRVRNGDPELLACITETLAAHEKNGGLPRTPDYAALLEFHETFDPEKTAEQLSDPQNVYALVRDFGAPDSPAFLTVLRRILAVSTPADKNRFRTLACAKGQCLGTPGATEENPPCEPPREALNTLLEMVDECRRLKLLREEREELDPVEIVTLTRECLGSYSFPESSSNPTASSSL